jgi:hypothetical protein
MKKRKKKEKKKKKKKKEKKKRKKKRKKRVERSSSFGWRHSQVQPIHKVFFWFFC